MIAKKSIVAGIVSPGGGFRVVVEKRHDIHCHVFPGERLYILPGVKVTEPVSFDKVPNLIKKVEDYVAEQEQKISFSYSSG